jgi:hypothetical protein
MKCLVLRSNMCSSDCKQKCLRRISAKKHWCGFALPKLITSYTELFQHVLTDFNAIKAIDIDILSTTTRHCGFADTLSICKVTSSATYNLE